MIDYLDMSGLLRAIPVGTVQFLLDARTGKWSSKLATANGWILLGNYATKSAAWNDVTTRVEHA
jgi:hypothetical protein